MKTTIEQLEDCTLVTLEGELNTAGSFCRSEHYFSTPH